MSEREKLSRPRGSNADEWHLFLCTYLDNRATTAGDGLAFIAVQICEAIEEQASSTALEALKRIVQWADAYPLDVFPEPDSAYYLKASEVLAANGMTLDRLSAAAMRHVVEGVGKIAREALGGTP